jgi:hypothetical protein
MPKIVVTKGRNNRDPQTVLEVPEIPPNSAVFEHKDFTVVSDESGSFPTDPGVSIMVMSNGNIMHKRKGEQEEPRRWFTYLVLQSSAP